MYRLLAKTRGMFAVVKKILLAFILLVQFASLARAGGSFAVDEEFALIKAQIPALWQAINTAFELEASGYANMIGNNVNERLGHRRVGPYCLAGKPKAQKGANTFLFCFNTEYLWLDAQGRETVMEKAFEVQEKFVSVEIAPIKN